MKGWQAARAAKAETRARHLASERHGPTDDAQAALDSYLRDLALSVRRRGWTMDSRRCVFCHVASRLRTGTLSHIGPVLFCPRCEEHYRLLRGDMHEHPELRIHYRDTDGTSLCGIGERLTDRKPAVTCLRCQSYLHNDSSLRRLVADFLG